MKQINSDIKHFELACVIVNFGLGSKVRSIAKKNGISGGTVVLGKGTMSNRWLEFFELTDIRKEIVFMIGEKSLVRNVLEVISDEFNFYKPNHGIGFTMPVGVFIGSGNSEYDFNTDDGGADSSMYKAIYVVVEKGKGEQVMDAAKEVGARGGTIINARGSSIHETAKFLNMEIEPEKELVLILAQNELAKTIVTAIRDTMKIDKPGQGIIFVQNVSETYGLNEA